MPFLPDSTTQQFSPVYTNDVVVATAAGGGGGSNLVYHPVVLPPDLWPHNFFYFSLLMSVYMTIFYFPLIAFTIPASALAVKVSTVKLHALATCMMGSL